jgi:hypothetical protein
VPAIATSTTAADGRTSYATSFTEDGPAVAVADVDTLITDLDSTTIVSARIVLTNPLNGAAESLSISGSLPAGITASSYNAATGLLTLSGSASLADYQSAIEAIRYTNTSQDPNSTTRRLEFTVNDGVEDSNVAVSTIAITPVNDSPDAINDTITVAEDSTTTLDLLANDVDIDGDELTVVSINGTTLTPGSAQTIAVTNGTVTVSAAGVISFTPAANFNGEVSFPYVISDGALQDSATVTITVTAVNDPPLLNANGVQVTDDFVREIPFGNTTDAGDTNRPAVALMQPGVTNLADLDSDSFQLLSLTVLATSIQDGTAEKLVITGATLTGTIDPVVIALAPASGAYTGTVAFSLGGVDYTATLGESAGSSSATFRTISFSRTDNALIAKAAAEALLDALAYTNTAPTPTTSARRTFELTATDDLGAISNATEVVITLGNGPVIDLDGDGPGFNSNPRNREVTFTENGDPADNGVAVLLATNGTAQGGINLQPLYESATYSLVGSPIAGLTLNSNGSWTYDTATSSQTGTFNVAYSWQDSADATKFGNHFFTITVSDTGSGLVATSNRPLSAAPGANIGGTLAPSVDRLGIGINKPLFVDSGNEFLVIAGATLTSANGQPASGNVRLSFLSAPSTALGAHSGTFGTFTLGDTSYRYEFVQISADLNRVFFTLNTGSGSGGTLTYAQAEALIDAYGYLNTSEDPATTNRSLNFGVFSEGLGNAPATATIKVVPVNDPPDGTDKTISLNEDASYTFTAADFGFSDPKESNALLAVKITTLPAAGTLKLDGVDVTAGQSIVAADIGKLVYIPAANGNGTSYASFTFQVQDDGGTANGGVDLDSTPNTITFDVAALNDAPAGTDNTIGINEDGSHSFAPSDFGFSDPNDTPANSLLAVTITSLPAAGTMTLDGNAVTAGQSIAAADITKLVYSPAANANGTGYASFTFQVQDDGGTANGGVDLDQSANTITFNVAAVNDPPLLDLDDSDPATTATGYSTTFNAGGAAVAITASTSITDIDNTQIVSAVITLTNRLDGASESLSIEGSLPNGITPSSYNAATGVLTLTGPASLADFQSALSQLRYANTAATPNSTARVINVTVNDGTANSNTAVSTVSIADPRTITVEGLNDVSEGSNAIFSVSLSANASGIAVSLLLGNAGDSASSGDYSALTGVSAYYYDNNNTKQILSITAGAATIPAGVVDFFVSVPTTVDAVYEGPESFTLRASAFGKSGSDTATILDDGTGKIYDDQGVVDPNGGSPDDDRAITVTGKPDVSEGTNAIFTVALTGNPSGTDVVLTLGKQDDQAVAADYNPITSATAYYFVGTVKTVLTINNGTVTLPPGITSFFVSVRTTQDAAYEGPELFTLEASAFGGSKTASDTSTILDNGTGQSYDDKGVPIAGATPDDDRTIGVTAYGQVNEASTYAMFSVSAIAGNTLDLTLQNASSGTSATWAGFTPLEFSTDGTNWSPYASNSKPTVPQNGTVYVRASITSEQDLNFEGAETFALKAAYTTNTAKSASADTSIVDDGTGKKYGPDFSGGVPQESTDSLDSDTGLSVNSITVNESSPFAVFTVSGAPNLDVSLQLTNGATTGLSGLATSSDNGATWIAYTTGTVPLNASGKLLVRTSLTPEQETLFENSETFTLTATPTAGTAATGTATVLDDGTGTIFNDNGTANNSQIKDDDRVLTVNSITVNEGSTYAVFTLSAHRGQSLSLGLSNGIQNTSARPGDGTPADGTEDYDPTSLQVWDPTSGGSGAWVAYTGPFTVPGAGVASTPVLVRLKINPDAVFEGPEDVRLTATYTSGAPRSATGTATIVDNGTGTKFPDAPPNAGPSPVTDTTNLDDDRLLVSVSSVTVAEGTDPFAAVTVSISRPAATDISFTPFLSNGTATAGTDFGPALQWRPAGSTDENAWTNVTGALTIPTGQTALELRTPILDDLFFEPTERFTVNTGVISGPVANPSGAVGTVTITDSDVLVGSLAVSLVSTGNETGSVPNVFRITRTGDTTAALVVPFTISGIRQLGVDYGDPTTAGVTFDPASSSGTMTINAGQSSADLTIPTVDNAIVDGTRALPLSLAAVPGYTLSPSSAQGSILDNDTAAPPEVSIGQGNVVEPDLGQTRFVNLSIQLSRPATQDTVITYDVVPAVESDVAGRLGFDGQPLGIATPNVDYTPISGSVTLAAGLTSTIIAVPVIGDNIDENDEVLYARITSVSGGNGATISTSANRGEIIIIDNENTSGLNIDYTTSPNGIEIRGGTGNDVITGSRFADTIFGNEGNDYLRGGLGADILTGGPGADIFAYNGERDPITVAPESVLATMDRIRDFAPGGGLSTGDRIQFTGQAALDLQAATGSATANGLPSAIFNATLPTALTDLNQAIQAAFRDKNPSTAGDQPLGLGEAVIFTQRSGRVTNTYMIVNTRSAGFDSSTDFMVNITGWSSSGFGRGQLAVSDFFQSSLI